MRRRVWQLTLAGLVAAALLITADARQEPPPPPTAWKHALSEDVELTVVPRRDGTLGGRLRVRVDGVWRPLVLEDWIAGQPIIPARPDER